MDGNKTTRILIPEQYNITIAKQYSVIKNKCIILSKKNFLLIFKNMVEVYVVILAKKSLYFFITSCLFAHLPFHVLIFFKSTIFLKISLRTLSNWYGKDSGTNKSSNRRLSQTERTFKMRTHLCLQRPKTARQFLVRNSWGKQKW